MARRARGLLAAVATRASVPASRGVPGRKGSSLTERSIAFSWSRHSRFPRTFVVANLPRRVINCVSGLRKSTTNQYVTLAII